MWSPQRVQRVRWGLLLPCNNRPKRKDVDEKKLYVVCILRPRLRLELVLTYGALQMLTYLLMR